MKNYRNLDSVTLAILAVGTLMIPTLKGRGTQDSADVTKLLADTMAVGVQLKIDSIQMQSFTRLKLSWESYAAKLNAIRVHINNAGQLVAKLKAAESKGSPCQQTTVKRIGPMLREMADNLTATINHLNDDKNKFHFPEFTVYT